MKYNIAVYPGNILKKDRNIDDEGTSKNPNLIGLFVTKCVQSLNDPDGTATSSAKALSMATTGYDLVDDYCAQFFLDGGENQKWLGLSKDLIAAIGTLGTGIAALATSSGSTTAAIALGTATAYNGADIYARNFLFGADNIDSVRTIVFAALTTHRNNTIAARLQTGSPAPVWTFGAAKLQIEDHQAICQFPKIRELVVEAVKGGTVTAYTPSGKQFTSDGQPRGGGGANLDPTAHLTVRAGGQAQ